MTHNRVCHSVLCKGMGQPLKFIGKIKDDEGVTAKVWECKRCGYFENQWLD